MLCRGMRKRPRNSRKRVNCGLRAATAIAWWKAKSSSTAASPRRSAVSIASSARLIRLRLARVIRSAARPAVSTSTPVRSSMTCSTSDSERSSAGSMRNGRRCTSRLTKAPTPWRVSTSPSERSAATASRTTVRLTPKPAIISCSVGRRAPGAIRRLMISPASRSTRPLARLCARGRRPSSVGCLVWSSYDTTVSVSSGGARVNQASVAGRAARRGEKERR